MFEIVLKRKNAVKQDEFVEEKTSMNLVKWNAGKLNKEKKNPKFCHRANFEI